VRHGVYRVPFFDRLTDNVAFMLLGDRGPPTRNWNGLKTAGRRCRKGCVCLSELGPRSSLGHGRRKRLILVATASP